MSRVTMLVSALLLLHMQACAMPPFTGGGTEAVSPVQGNVTDRASFDRFIDTRPTPEQFRARYPDVALVLPGTITTKELRTDNSRFFAELDPEGRITGGRFR